MEDPPEPYYPGLDLVYDKEHRARFIERHVEGVEIVPMRMRGHNADDMPYDVRYEPYFEMAGLLPFVLQFKRKPPTFNHTALTALIDRWRPETHTFHLPCGEMTVTLQDFAMITGLPIDGEALTGRVDNIGWRQRVFGLTGRQPPLPPEGKKDTRTSGVYYTWLRQFGACPADADAQVVQQYARAYIWYVLTKVIFPDTSGDTASWMWLDPLRDWNVKYSWGAAGLAFLYRQLDMACRKKGSGASLGGAVWPLTIWMWERIPVGRPRKLTRNAWDYDLEGDEWWLPTIAYEWDKVEGYKDSSMGRYKSYTNELDTLTFDLVEWTPYRWERSFRINAMCLRDQALWRIKCPMICFYAVEWHLPQRVAKQFGRRQHTPPANQSTSVDLHRIDRKKCPKEKEWDRRHKTWVDMWNDRAKTRETDGTMDRESDYVVHLAWHEEQHRLKLKPAWTTQDCLDLGAEDGDNEYNLTVRESAGNHKDYAPVFNRVGLELNRSVNEAAVALSKEPDTEEAETSLRGTLTSIMRRCRRMAALLACHGSMATNVNEDRSEEEVEEEEEGEQEQEHSEEQEGEDGSEEEAEEEEEDAEEEDEEEEDPSWEERNVSQGAPQPTQPSQPTGRTRTRKKIFSPEGQKLPARSTRRKAIAGSSRPEKLASKRGRGK